MDLNNYTNNSLNMHGTLKYFHSIFTSIIYFDLSTNNLVR